MAETRWIVPLADVLVDDRLRAAVDQTLRSGWWSMGPRVAEFEQSFAALVDASHAVAVSNGTAALHLSLLAAGCGRGDEVILPSLNFVAAANAISHTGATPVFCDVSSPTSPNLDPADLETALTPLTKAIVVLHYAGAPCDMDAVLELAGSRGIVVIEDAAHAVGATWRGRPCGSIGSLGCFSFFSNKNLATGEGGMVVTNDDELAADLRRLRSHGMTTLTWDRHRGHAHTYDVVAQGFNYRMDEIHATLGLVQLERLPAGNAARRSFWERYRTSLEQRTDLIVPFAALPEGSTSSCHIAPVVLAHTIDRTSLRDRLAARGIQTSVHYPPIHTFTQYARATQRPLPVTEDVAPRLLTLPLYPHMGDSAVDLVVGGLAEELDRQQRTA
ncbi:MAG: DegT/DnrJ/EryC1/StrS family aminotransferase [Gaiella sp.]|nr:DegT/DnrJ/EryC1/StrS family aminotransferase [Gaiella sp.]